MLFISNRSWFGIPSVSRSSGHPARIALMVCSIFLHVNYAGHRFSSKYNPYKHIYMIPIAHSILVYFSLPFQMGGLECVITGLMDEFCLFFAKKKYAREIFTLCAVCVSFAVATINVTPVKSPTIAK